MNVIQRYWLVLVTVPTLGLGIYVGLHSGMKGQGVSALWVIGALMLVGGLLVLLVRLERARTLRERVLTRRVRRLQGEVAKLQVEAHLLKVQAHYDGLTGLANRLLLADRFRFAVERAKRNGKSFALLMIDLNGFKTINDNYGHSAGDAVLVTIARRLAGAVRACDTVARLGGDEFVLIIESIDDARELDLVSEKLFDTMAVPIVLKHAVEVRLGASLGLAMYPDHGADLSDLLNIADQAMYECKASGPMRLR